MRCVRPIANLHAEPSVRAPCVSQCLFGERVAVLSRREGWCRVRSLRDGYEGWQAEETLHASPPSLAATHRVAVSATLVFAAPDIKSPVLARLPLGAELALEEGSGREPFARVGNLSGDMGAWAWRAHCLALGRTLEGTPVALARRLFANTPYLWGGRTPDGADCSGLVQSVAFALGHALPRDSGDQERWLERRVAADERAESDLVFWPGHVGLLVDAETVFHATAHRLASVVEPLADIVARAGAPSSVRRLPASSAGGGASGQVAP